MEFYKYLKRELGLSVSAIGYLEKKYGDEPSDIVINRIMQLLDALIQAGLDAKYINQCNNILDVIDVYNEDEFLSRLEYIKKLNKKRSPYMNINIITALSNINSKNNLQEFDKIIDLLEREGLSDILQDKSLTNSKILYSSSYIQIYNNLNILRQIRNYRSLIRDDVSILYKSTPNELQKMVKEIKEKELQDKNESKNSDNLYNNVEDELLVEKKQDIFDENINKNNDNFTNLYDVDDDSIRDENQEKDKNSVEKNVLDQKVKKEYKKDIMLGNEDNLTYVLNILKINLLPYAIILKCPEILRRRNLKQIYYIIQLMKENSISLNTLEYCPEILQKCNYNQMLKIINGLKSQGLSLNIISVCPEILILSNPKKIDKIVEVLEKNNINKYLIYSCPQILISGDTKILIEIHNELQTNYADIDLILDIAPYTFVEKIYNNSVEKTENGEYVKKNNILNSGSITIIKNIDELQKTINILKENDISTDILKKTPEMLNKLSGKQVKEVIEEVNNQGFKNDIFEAEPRILALSNMMSIREITNSVKKHIPDEYKQIIMSKPQIYFKSDKQKIENVFNILDKHSLDKKNIIENPEILVRKEEKEIDKIFVTLIQKGFSKNDIEKRPMILIDGDSKYIDNNIELFERNKIQMPLNILYVKPTENIERNIDILIENNLYKYIEERPQILNIDNPKLEMHIEVAKRKSIPLVKKDESGKVNLNIEYFEMGKKEVCQKYDLNYRVYSDLEKGIENKKVRKIKNPELYRNVYCIFQKQAKNTLKEYNKDDVSYYKNNKIVSEQRLIKETYIDLEENVSNNGRDVLKKANIDVMLSAKLDKLTSNSGQSRNIRKENMNRQKDIAESSIIMKNNDIRNDDKPKKIIIKSKYYNSKPKIVEQKPNKQSESVIINKRIEQKTNKQNKSVVNKMIEQNPNKQNESINNKRIEQKPNKQNKSVISKNVNQGREQFKSTVNNKNGKTNAKKRDISNILTK